MREVGAQEHHRIVAQNWNHWFSPLADIDEIHSTLIEMFRGAKGAKPPSNQEIENSARAIVTNRFRLYPNYEIDHPDVWKRNMERERTKLREFPQSHRGLTHQPNRLALEQWRRQSLLKISEIATQYARRLIQVLEQYERDAPPGVGEVFTNLDGLKAILLENSTDPYVAVGAMYWQINNQLKVLWEPALRDSSLKQNYFSYFEVLSNSLFHVTPNNFNFYLELIYISSILNALFRLDIELRHLSFTTLSTLPLILGKINFEGVLNHGRFRQFSVDAAEKLLNFRARPHVELALWGYKQDPNYWQNLTDLYSIFAKKDQLGTGYARPVHLEFGNGIANTPYRQTHPEVFRYYGQLPAHGYFLLPDPGMKEPPSGSKPVEYAPWELTVDKLVQPHGDEIYLRGTSVIDITSSWFAIPTPPRYEAVAITARDVHGQIIPSQRGVFDPVHNISWYYIPMEYTFNGIQLDVRLKKLPPPRLQQVAIPRFNSAQINKLSQHLAAQGLARLGQSLRSSLGTADVTSASRLSQFFKQSTLYSYVQTEWFDSAEGLKVLRHFLNSDEVLCFQCNGAALLLAESLRFLLAGEPYWEVRVRTVVGKRGIITTAGHAIVELRYDGQHVAFLDSTPSEFDPRSPRPPDPSQRSHVHEEEDQHSLTSLLQLHRSEVTPLIPVQNVDFFELSVNNLRNRRIAFVQLINRSPTLARQVFQRRTTNYSHPVAEVTHLAAIAIELANGESSPTQVCAQLRLMCRKTPTFVEAVEMIKKRTEDLDKTIKILGDEINRQSNNSPLTPLLEPAKNTLTAIKSIQWQQRNSCKKLFVFTRAVR